MILLLESINKNSFYKNEILVHINEGNDGTIEYIEDLNIKFKLQPNLLSEFEKLSRDLKIAESNFESLNHHGNFLSIRPLVFQIETLQLWLEI